MEYRFIWMMGWGWWWIKVTWCCHYRAPCRENSKRWREGVSSQDAVSPNTHARVHTQTHTHTHTHKCTHTATHTHMHTPLTHSHKHIYLQTHILFRKHTLTNRHTLTQTPTHSHTLTQTHTQSPISQSLSKSSGEQRDQCLSLELILQKWYLFSKF